MAGPFFFSSSCLSLLVVCILNVFGYFIAGCNCDLQDINIFLCQKKTGILERGWNLE
jgi:hypothetical protein